MALKSLVKVGGVNNLSDARYCAGMGVDLIGFIFQDDGRKTITLEEYTAITQWLSGPKFVGEFQKASDADILELHQQLNFDFVQTSDLAQLMRLKAMGLSIIYDMPTLTNLQTADLDYLVVNDPLLISDDELKLLCDNYPVLLGKNLDSSHLNEIITEFKPAGLHLMGSDEIRPGYKDFDEMSEILESLEID